MVSPVAIEASGLAKIRPYEPADFAAVDHVREHGLQLHRFCLEYMRESGMQVATVGTGGDDAHVPARASYERAGFKAHIPHREYYMDLTTS